MTTLTTARDAAAVEFRELMKTCFQLSLDKETDAVKLAAARMKAREIAGIHCERLLALADDCRREVYDAQQTKLMALQEDYAAANSACTTVRAESIAAMEALYGGAGINFAQLNQSVKEQEANAAALRLLDERGRIEVELKTLTTHKDNGTRETYSVAALDAMNSASVANVAVAYLDAAVSGKLVA